MTRLLIAAVCLLAAGTAEAETAEEAVAMPTDGAANHLFLLNPALIAAKDGRADVLGVHGTRSSSFDHLAAGGDKLTSAVTDDFVGAAVHFDLGAGAGIGFEGVEQFHHVATSFDGADKPDDEYGRNVEGDVHLVVELTEGLTAGLKIRYVADDVTVLGSPRLAAAETTHYHATFLGIGSGLAYRFKSGSLGYTYYPPLHGKTTIDTQQEIIDAPGFIALDGNVTFPSQVVTLGLTAKRWINQTDQLAAGTTAPDNKTSISLYGLDPDQYVINDEMIMAGADWHLNKQMALRFAAGEVFSHFDFTNLFEVGGVDVQNQGMDQLRTKLARAVFHFENPGVGLDAGVSYYQRSYGFSAAEGEGSYQSTGEQLFVALNLRL